MKAIKKLLGWLAVTALGVGAASLAWDTWMQVIAGTPGQTPLLPVPTAMQALMWTALALAMFVVVAVDIHRTLRGQDTTGDQAGPDDDTDDLDDHRRPVGSGRHSR
jgi:hypothetical protein